jgi:hypothetical protein
MEKHEMSGKRETKATVDIKIRMREPLRGLIERAAKGNSVSMNAEMVARLEKTFADDRQIDAVYGGAPALAIAKLIGVIIELMSGPGGRSDHWLHDVAAFDQTVRAVNAVLEQFRPMKERNSRAKAKRPKDPIQASWHDAANVAAATAGTHLAKMVVADMTGSMGGLPPYNLKEKKQLTEIGRSLGKLADRLDAEQLRRRLVDEGATIRRRRKYRSHPNDAGRK